MPLLTTCSCFMTRRVASISEVGASAGSVEVEFPEYLCDSATDGGLEICCYGGCGDEKRSICCAGDAVRSFDRL